MKTRNQIILDLFDGFDMSVRVTNKAYGFINQKFHAHEIVTSRVTIKHENRLIDFNISEVELHPISYSEKEYNQIQFLKRKYKLS
jgi:hypothetical protein